MGDFLHNPLYLTPYEENVLNHWWRHIIPCGFIIMWSKFVCLLYFYGKILRLFSGYFSTVFIHQLSPLNCKNMDTLKSITDYRTSVGSSEEDSNLQNLSQAHILAIIESRQSSSSLISLSTKFFAIENVKKFFFFFRTLLKITRQIINIIWCSLNAPL